jgi:MoxR-like ATPase
MKPSQIIDALDLLIDLKMPVLLTGEAGVGKSRIVQQVTKRRGGRLIDFRAPLHDPVDLIGVPHVNNGLTDFAPPSFLPRDGEGTLFLDEINRGSMMMQNSCLQLALDRACGQYQLPDGWAIVAAANPDTHRGVTKMSEAMDNRFVHLRLEPDVDDWTRWAIDADVRPELIAFVRFRPELLHQYDRNSTAKAYPTPRSWEAIGKILNSNRANAIEHALYAGAVGEGAAAELIGFLDVYRQLPSIDGILMNPKKAMVPEEPGALFAVSAALARKSTEANFDRVMAYADRIPREWAVYCVKDATVRDQRLCDTPAFIKFAAENSDIMG